MNEPQTKSTSWMRRQSQLYLPHRVIECHPRNFDQPGQNYPQKSPITVQSIITPYKQTAAMYGSTRVVLEEEDGKLFL